MAFELIITELLQMYDAPSHIASWLLQSLNLLIGLPVRSWLME